MAHGNDNGEITTPKFGGMFRNMGNNQNAADDTHAAVEAVADAVEVPKEMPPAVSSAPKPKKPAKYAKNSALRAKERDADKSKRITFYATQEEYTDCLIAKARLNKPVTDFARDATMGLIYNGYTCAYCGKSFILLNDEDSKKDKPSSCPCCGHDKLGKIVNV